MSLRNRLTPYVMTVITDPTIRDTQRFANEVYRRLRWYPHTVQYFHQVDDPYSHLAAQTLERLVERYDIALEPHLVGPPPDDAAPDRERLEGYARKDAGDIAPAAGLSFPPSAPEPALVRVARVQEILAAASPSAFPRRAATLGEALWAGDDAAIERLAATYGAADRATTDAAIAAGNQQRTDLGHYLGGTFHYGGEWYWGVDRLHYLEERLAALGARKANAPDAAIFAPPRPSVAPPPAGNRDIVVEAFVSLRSPYSYIAMDRILALPDRLPVELRLRPVLPMVMRGFQVPLTKRLYIVRDTKREAEALGLPFGFICDPVGEPVERGFSLYRFALDRGRAGEYLHAFMRAAFAEGIDLGTDDGLRHAVEAAGLSWAEAQAHREDTWWREELEANRRDLLDLGLWGVPCFRVSGGGRPPFSTWGQDRLWLVEAQVRERLEATGAGA